MSTANPWYLVSAAVLGAIGAAGIFIMEHLRQERRRHGQAQDLARLNHQLTVMRRELEQLRISQKDKNEKKRKRNKRKSISVLSSSTTDDYTSMVDIDSSDLEFYDFSDEDVAKSTSSYAPLNKELSKIDEQLDSGSIGEIKSCLEKLRDLCMEHPESPELLWRLAKAHYNIAITCADPIEKQDNINKGVEVCGSALLLNSNVAEIHKWYAILIGSRSDFQSTKEKISDGHVFKKHIDIAINLNPSDPSLHHLLGRFAYEVAGLKWYERKVATALYGEPPCATYQDALEHFMNAEKLSVKDWKENKMLIGKCLIASGDFQAGVQWLAEAVDIVSKDEVEEQFDVEIRTLLAKYNSYR